MEEDPPPTNVPRYSIITDGDKTYINGYELDPDSDLDEVQPFIEKMMDRGHVFILQNNDIDEDNVIQELNTLTKDHKLFIDTCLDGRHTSGVSWKHTKQILMKSTILKGLIEFVEKRWEINNGNIYI
jgi:hypothetical protein